MMVRIVAEMHHGADERSQALTSRSLPCELLILSSPDRVAESSRVRPVPTLNSPSDAVSKSVRRPINSSQDLGSLFEDQNGITSAEVGRELAKLIDAAFPEIQVGKVYRDLVHLRVISVQCEHNDSFHRLSQVISKIDSAPTKIDCRR